jgi:hypothetical protein
MLRSGRNGSEWVDGLHRNQWTVNFGMGGRNASEYAFKTQVPRHNEIVDELANKICKDLDIPFVR